MTFIKSLKRPRQSILGIGYELILSGADTDGQYELMRFSVPPNAGPPPHVHHREDECFHLLSGTLTVLRGEETSQIAKGDSVHLPRGLPHAFQNDSDSFAELLCWVNPATLESFFGSFIREWSESDDIPPAPGEADIQAMMAAAAKHDIEMLLNQA